MYFTDKDKIYSIRYYSYLINVEEPDYQGLFELSIECEDGQIFVASMIRFFVDHLFQFFLSQATVEGSIK